MKYAHVEDGVVLGVYVAESDVGSERGWVADPEGIAHVGAQYDGSKFIPESPPPLTWDDIRGKRQYLLRLSDGLMAEDSTVDRIAWRVYRQKLRDITKDFATPEDVVWPESPEALL